MLPHIVIGAFSGIRSAEIERLDWCDILWDRGYIEIKAAKAKTKARRLVPLLPNLRAWLEPMRKDEGAVCKCPNTSTRLNYIGEKAGFGWRQNALRHSFASYRLAAVQDAPKVALEMGNSPQMLFKHYSELVTPDAATAWFAGA
ncbi:MAG: site-specific integrase [Chthoniobacteraceae bacterium]